MILTEQTAPMLDAYLKKGFHDLDFQTYLNTFGISSHGLMDIRRSPKYYRFRRDNPMQSDSLALGSLVHKLVLEPEDAAKVIKVAPKVDRRTKLGKEEYEAFMSTVQKGDLVADADDWKKLQIIKAALYDNEFSAKIVKRTDALKEKSAFWVHEATQTFCKIRPDLAFLDGDIIVDIKTTQNAHPMSFMKDSHNFHYDMQAAFYMDGYRAITGRNANFVFLCVETSAPFDVACYHVTDQMYGFGKLRYEKALMTYAQCFHNNKWPGYAKKAIPLNLPAWAETAEQNLEDMHANIGDQ